MVRLLLAAAAVCAMAQTPDFQRDIRPLLGKKCVACHGPDEHGRQAGLRLDTFAGATKNGAIVPGDAAKSRVLARVTHATRPMPPAGPRLTESEVGLLRTWIDAGAKYTNHWAYEKPKRAAFPPAANAIDHFVQAKWKELGLTGAKGADRGTLARRAALDLIGVPPEEAALNAYLKGGTFEKYVDTLLASPQFGERWAKVWLDLARYADTQGYEKDSKRSIWPYRDWVIRAFNDNLPFDQFTILQLAGDLVEDSSVDDLIATGFHRNTMTNTEGGTDDEEFRDLAIRDRVATTGQVWMGQTWGCAQCHTHKYDPLSHREFYQIYAFFNQTADDDHPTDRPVLKLTAKASTPVLRELAAEKQRKTRIYDRGNYLTPGEEVTAAVPAAFHPLPAKAPKNRLGFAQWLVSAENPLTARVTVNRFWSRVFGRGLVESEEDFGTQGIGPTHPELLDILALDFQKDWNVKKLLKRIVMSTTYQQASDVTPELLKADPANKYYARGSRFRLDAEVVRDQALAAAGLLSRKQFGPPVMPWQPEGVWLVVYNGDNWETSSGEDRYRRALYTFMRRTSAYPSMMNFDAPNGETCTIRRIRTNTPLQALTAMNDPAFMEAAQKLALLAMKEAPLNPAKRLFERVLLRPPTAAEAARLVQLQRQTELELRGQPENVSKLLRYDEVLYTEDRVATLIPDGRTTPKEWRYATADPGADWMKPEFNDSHWGAGPGYFGKLAKPSETQPIRTKWDTETLYLRYVLELPTALPGKFKMPVRTNAQFDVWVNGVSALNNIYERSGHYEYAFNEDGQRAFRPGKNTIAIRVSRYGAQASDQIFDPGLIGSLPWTPERGKPGDAGRAAWVVVANTILNLDETVTRR
jgi:mono/diheme cytochrome c family protein